MTSNIEWLDLKHLKHTVFFLNATKKWALGWWLDPQILTLYKAQEAARPCRWRRLRSAVRGRGLQHWFCLWASISLCMKWGVEITVNDRKRYLKSSTHLYFSSALYFFLSWRPDFWGFIIYHTCLAGICGCQLWLERESLPACLFLGLGEGPPNHLRTKECV